MCHEIAGSCTAGIQIIYKQTKMERQTFAISEITWRPPSFYPSLLSHKHLPSISACLPLLNTHTSLLLIAGQWAALLSGAAPSALSSLTRPVLRPVQVWTYLMWGVLVLVPYVVRRYLTNPTQEPLYFVALHSQDLGPSKPEAKVCKAMHTVIGNSCTPLGDFSLPYFSSHGKLHFLNNSDKLGNFFYPKKWNATLEGLLFIQGLRWWFLHLFILC